MFGSRSLFKDDFPKNFIKTQQCPDFKIKHEYKDQLSDRFGLLKIQAELQLSIMSGLCDLQGHGEYLSKEKSTERIVSYSLFYSLETACEKLMTAFSEIRPFIDTDVFDDKQYTHVVVEINWGANNTLSLEHYCKDFDQKLEIEGLLKIELTKLSRIINLQGANSGNYKSSSTEKLNQINVDVHADVYPKEGVPTTIDKAVEFISQLPELLQKVNDGKGKPLKYIMIPISTFAGLCKFEKAIDVMIQTIDASFITQTVYLFEELAILKQRLNDLKRDVTSHSKYLPEHYLKEIRDMQQDVKTNETKLKTCMAGYLPKIRARQTKMDVLIAEVEKLKRNNLKLYRIEGFLDKFTEVKSKINDIDNYLSNKIIYLGKDENLDSLIIGNAEVNFFVLYTSKELKEEDVDLSRNTLHHFLLKAKSSKINSKYVVVDLDLKKHLNKEIEKIKIIHYKNGRVVSYDVYKDYEKESVMNFANSTDMELVDQKPKKRVLLELSCPGLKKDICSDDTLLWNCINCKDYLEYGFDEKYFYCRCGRARIQSYELKCNAPTHGGDYFPISCHSFLKQELQKLKPLKEMNILILGQSGVGKSTWINSIVNYLRYDTLEDAAQGGVVCVIPAMFTISKMTENDSSTQEIKIGKDDPNENLKDGEAATQMPKTYYFILKDRFVRLIDTPGLGDPGGVSRDKENMKNVLEHISSFHEIHGICILMKPNERRLDAMFKFCIKELLINLHKNAGRNILFCFTNSRSSNYKPGDTTNVLRSLIKTSNLEDTIKLSHKTTFCLDNEAFRFLCELKYPNVLHTVEDRKMYAYSWARSVAETNRFFEQIKELKPHLVADSATICNTRYRILNLTGPLANISRDIQENLMRIEKKKKEIANSTITIENPKKILYFSITKLQAVPLDHPRTVCTNSTCVEDHESLDTGVSSVVYN